jgi:chemotaxis family two-component system sensor histidine kinase/response regulator PixL
MKTILVIDDNVVLARAFARVLSGTGYQVHTCYSAEDGLRQARTAHPDGIILDLQMPFVNGVGFLYRLRSDPSLGTTPVMVVTGMPVSEQRAAELAELGAVVRLKPLGLGALIAETEALLSQESPTAPAAA